MAHMTYAFTSARLGRRGRYPLGLIVHANGMAHPSNIRYHKSATSPPLTADEWMRAYEEVESPDWDQSLDDQYVLAGAPVSLDATFFEREFTPPFVAILRDGTPPIPGLRTLYVSDAYWAVLSAIFTGLLLPPWDEGRRVARFVDQLITPFRVGDDQQHALGVNIVGQPGPDVLLAYAVGWISEPEGVTIPAYPAKLEMEYSSR